jgi:N-acetylglucosamine kinase-like BadF-type ATPase
MDLVIGADGGGTKTACAIAQMNGRIIGLGYAGPSNHLRLPGRHAQAAEAVLEGAQAAFADSGMAGARVRQAYLALAGVGTDGVNVKMMDAARQVLDAEEIIVDNDAVAGLAAATGQLYGVVIIAGTGSIAVAVDREGRRARSGGWGYRIGDEGSGQWIGRLGLAAAARAHDGRGGPTALVARALEHFSIETVDEIRSVLYRQPTNNRDIADFCVQVVAAAWEGDEVAMDIIGQAGRELALAAWAAARSLGMDSTEFPVSPNGSVFKAGDVITSPFKEELGRLAPTAEVVSAPFPPVVGAVILALLSAGVKVDSVVQENLERSWEEVRARHERLS